MGGERFITLFPRLYNIVISKEPTIFEMGVWRDGSWCWNMEWRRRLFSWEEELLENLLQLLLHCSVQQNFSDSWVWLGDPSSVYSVKSAYRLISENGPLVDAKFYKSLWDKMSH